MQLKYANTIMKPEDGMKKVSAICWAPSGRKMAVAAADRVFSFLFRPFISSMTMERKRTNSPPNPPIRDKSLTW